MHNISSVLPYSDSEDDFAESCAFLENKLSARLSSPRQKKKSNQKTKSHTTYFNWIKKKKK